MENIICLAEKANGDLCLAISNDGSGKCGRHGGMSERTVKRLKISGYEPNGDRIMRKNSKIIKKKPKKTLSRDSDGDVIMRKTSR